jgi:hypothetical protein
MRQTKGRRLKRIKSVVINGKRWLVKWCRLPNDWGTCSNAEHLIELDHNIKDPVTYAEILTHEMLHGMFPEVEEDYISQRASELTVALNRAGLIAKDDE